MSDDQADLDPRTPVLVGVGEFSERIDDPGYRALSEAEVATAAVRAALADTGLDDTGLDGDGATVAAAIDAAAMTRSFAGMGVGSRFGGPDSLPWAVLRRVGAAPAYVRHEVLGGQTPQSLVNEMAARIATGEHTVALIYGADITSTERHLSRQAREGGGVPDWSEEVDAGPVDDRGRGTHLVNDRYGVAHGLISAPIQYALLENARRHRLGQDRATYRAAMAELMAPMSRVAAQHPHSASPERRSVAEVAEESAANRRVVDPYLRLMIARDQVNQGAACLLMSLERARAFGIDPTRWVYLHGHSSLTEQHLLRRPDLSAAPATRRAVQHALDLAGTDLAGIAHLDLYSCFPIAITSVLDSFAELAAPGPDGRPRELTVTGGLPYFGGAGSNYALHAIAEVVRRVRREPGSRGLVGANGGLLSKYAVGIYAATPAPWRFDDSASLQRGLDAMPSVPVVEAAEPDGGTATIESWTVAHERGRRHAVLLCRDAAGRRLLAVSREEDLLDRLDGSDGTDDPVGTAVRVHHDGSVNVATGAIGSAAGSAAGSAPRPHPCWARNATAATGIDVRVDGHVLEIVLDRPAHGNALDRAAQAALAAVITDYLADAELWVAVLSGRGSDFCTGVDPSLFHWGYTSAGPPSGFGGITGRDLPLDKPLVAAVRGAATDAGLELLLACDLVVAADDARFALTQASRGLAAEHGGPERLSRFVGARLADEMLLTGRELDAEEALAAGLVNQVVPAGTEVDAARELAVRITERSPVALAAQRRMLRGDRRGLDAVSFSEDLLIAQRGGGSAGRGGWRNI